MPRGWVSYPSNKGGAAEFTKWVLPPSLGACWGGCVTSAPFLSFLQIRCQTPPHRLGITGGGLVTPPPGSLLPTCRQWGAGGCLLAAPSVPSLALCLPSLTKSLSSLMAALITEFISGPACPAGGPGEGASPLGLAWGPPPTPVPHQQAQPWDAATEQRAATRVSHPTQNSVPTPPPEALHPGKGPTGDAGVGCRGWELGGIVRRVWGFAGPGEWRAAAEPISVASGHRLVCG